MRPTPLKKLPNRCKESVPEPQSKVGFWHFIHYCVIEFRVTGLPPKLKTGIRKAPARPTPSSDSEDEEEDTANHTTDGLRAPL